jgi:D-alanyl-D-alanine carboxypeptidase
MNYFSKELGLQQIWGNCSGLSLNPNFSTPEAIIILSALAMKNEFFKKIVGTKEITIDIKNDRYGLSKKKSWRNTNRLLEKGWEGVKTGTTETAGHCLISKKDNWLIGVFDCQTMSKRFS